MKLFFLYAKNFVFPPNNGLEAPLPHQSPLQGDDHKVCSFERVRDLPGPEADSPPA